MAIEKFKPLVDSFNVGNWIRVQVDDEIFKLRLLEYSIDFGSFEKIPVEFSDITKIKNGITDVEDILSQASSMATSYDSVQRQADQGNKARNTINQWITDGLNSALVSIQSNDNEDITLTKNGLLCRSYDDVTGVYSPEQLKLTHNIMAYTDNDWESVKLAIGKHEYVMYDNNLNSFVDKVGYGINADFVTAGVVSGSQIIGGDIYSDNYSIADGTGSYLNLRDGTFSFGGGALRFEGGKLLISSPDIPTTDTITEINEEYLKTTTVYAEGLQVKAANIQDKLTATQINTDGLIAENIYGTTITGKDLIGGSLLIGDKDSTYAEITNDGNLYSNSGKISIFNFNENEFYAKFNNFDNPDNDYKDYHFKQDYFRATVCKDLLDDNNNFIAGGRAHLYMDICEDNNVPYGRVRIDSNGFVDIGRYDDGSTLASFGAKNNAITFYVDVNYNGSLNNLSDKRMKNDLGSISEIEMRNILNNLDIKKFTYKSDDGNRTKYGIFAQDLRDILMEYDIGYISALSIYDKSANKYITDLNHLEDDVVYGVDYTQFIPLLIKAYQSLMYKVEQLEGKIE